MHRAVYTAGVRGKRCRRNFECDTTKGRVDRVDLCELAGFALQFKTIVAQFHPLSGGKAQHIIRTEVVHGDVLATDLLDGRNDAAVVT